MTPLRMLLIELAVTFGFMLGAATVVAIGLWLVMTAA